MDDELIDANPAARLALPKTAKRRDANPPTAKELQKILGRAAQDAQDIIRTIAGLGLRPGEALALRWCDVDAKRWLVPCSLASDPRAGRGAHEDAGRNAARLFVPRPREPSSRRVRGARNFS